MRHSLFASTVAVYRIVDRPIAETHPLDPRDIYGMSEVIGEHLCHGL